MGFFSILGSIFGWLGYLILGFLALQIVRCVIIPKKILKAYSQQGVLTQFFLLLGSLKRERGFEKTHKDILGYFKQLAKTNPDVPALMHNFGSRIDVSLLDPKLIKEFYRNESFYQRGFTTKAMRTLIGTGLFVAEGDLWKTHRKVISSMFHFEFLKQNVPVTIATAREFFAKIQKDSLKNVNIESEIQKITGEVVGRVFFSEKLNEYTFKGEPLTMYLSGMLTRMPRIFKDPKVLFLVMTGLDLDYSPKYRQFSQDMKEFRQVCHKIIQDRKASAKTHNDLLGKLLETQTSNSQNPHEIFSDEDIINEFLTFFIAGMDTTGQLVTMTLLLLHLNPQYIEEIKRETEEIYNKEEIPSIDTLNKMTMTHGIVKESLRLYGPSPNMPARKALQDHNLGDLKIKKGMFVRPVPVYNSLNSKYFDEPEKFKPERWTEKKEVSLDPFAFIPFSAGARNCIGQHLAMIEAKVIVIEFFRMFSRSKLVPEDYDLIMTFVSLYKPKNPVILELERGENMRE